MNAAVTPLPHPSLRRHRFHPNGGPAPLMAQLPPQRVMVVIAVTLALLPAVLFAVHIALKETTP